MAKWLANVLRRYCSLLYAVLSSLEPSPLQGHLLQSQPGYGYVQISDRELELENIDENLEYRFVIYAGSSLYSVDEDPVQVLFSQGAYEALYSRDMHVWSIMLFIIEEELA